MPTRTCRALCLATCASLLWAPSPSLAGPVEDLLPGQWYEVPDSRLRAIDPEADSVYNPNWPGTAPWRGGEGLAGLIDDWCGGAFDTRRDRLVVWGGGHGGYAGNELYAFGLDTLRWEMLVPPYVHPDYDVGLYCGGDRCGLFEPCGHYANRPVTESDVQSQHRDVSWGYPRMLLAEYCPLYASLLDPQQPRSFHTYDYLVYSPGIDSFCSLGFAAPYPNAQAGAPPETACFSFQTSQWVRKADTPSHGIGAFSARDDGTGLVWTHGTGGRAAWAGGPESSSLSVWDPVADQWTQRTAYTAELSSAIYKTAAVDPVRHLFVAVGAGATHVWNLAGDDGAGHVPWELWTTTGDKTVEQAANPGFEYDPASDRFVGWHGGTDVYTLDADARVWTRHPPAAGSSVVPTAANERGTYGRFRYSPRKNVFVVVNGVDENVYLYRLNPGGGVAFDAGTLFDAGVASDAGPDADAGAVEDAGDAGVDATSPDAGVDAGLEATGDAGSLGDDAATPSGDAGSAEVASGSCGCGAGPGSVGAWALMPVALARRRGRRAASGAHFFG